MTDAILDVLRSKDEGDDIAVVPENPGHWRVVRLPEWWIPSLEIDADNGRVKHGPVPVIHDGATWTRKPNARERREWRRMIKEFEAENTATE
jgi:hypothetical protein